MSTANVHSTNFTKQTEKSLMIIQNAMWSLKSMISDNADIDQNTKDQYNELLNIMMIRLDRIVETIESGLEDTI